MKELSLWLQNNPTVVLIMFIVAVLSGIITIFLGWKSFYQDYLSKSITIPVWLLIIILFFSSLLIVHFSGKESKYSPNKELIRIEGKRFGVQQITLDGYKFVRCEFDGSELVYNGSAAISLDTCTLKNSRITFGQYAENTLKTLTLFYADPPFRPIMEKTIDNIRTGKHPTTAPPVSILNK